jgi:hypothetical protein
MGGIGWNEGPPEQACDGGGHGWEKVTGGSADGRLPTEKVWT